MQKAIILFDGVCNLCNGAVQFILKWEKHPNYQFGSLQSEAAQKLLKDFPDEKIADSIVLIDDGKLFQKSSAVLKILAHLKWFWIFKYLIFLPTKFRDYVYDFIARNRYRWFGKRSECRIPTEKEKSRFL